MKLLALIAGIIYAAEAAAACPGGDAQNDYIVKSAGCKKSSAAASWCAYPVKYKQYWDTLGGPGCSLKSAVFSSSSDIYSNQELLVLGAFPNNTAVHANNSAVNCRKIVDPDGNGVDSGGFRVFFISSQVDEL